MEERGRRVRRRHRPAGQARREALLRATVDVIAAQGVAGVTHRTVTEAAGVPLATVSYFFDSIDELAAEAIRVFTSRRVEEVNQAVQAAAESSAGTTVAENRLADRAQLIAMVEAYLHAAREPDMRELAAEMLTSFENLAASTLRRAGAPEPESSARSFVALIDGYTLHSMASADQQVAVDDLNDALSALFVGHLLLDGHTEQALTLAAMRNQ